MKDRFNFRIPVFTDKDTFIEFEYTELGDSIDEPLAGHIGEPQQCTGIKDIKNNLIYEGDILKDVDGTYRIMYHEDLCQLVALSTENNFCKDIIDLHSPQIISNIYGGN